MRGPSGLLAAIAVAACGSGGGQPLTRAQGTIHGHAFAAADAISNTATDKGFAFSGPSSNVKISDYDGACAKEAANQGVPGGQEILLVLAQTDPTGKSGPVTQPGEYTVIPGSGGGANAPDSKLAQVYWELGCFKQDFAFADGGKVTVTSAQSGLTGTFDVTFGADHILGAFDAPLCTSLDPNRTPTNGC